MRQVEVECLGSGAHRRGIQLWESATAEPRPARSTRAPRAAPSRGVRPPSAVVEGACDNLDANDALNLCRAGCRHASCAVETPLVTARAQGTLNTDKPLWDMAPSIR
jgi:hypothetical protein